MTTAQFVGVVVLVIGLLVGLILLAGRGCVPASPGSPLIGRWQTGEVQGSLFVYPDRKVSFYGVMCRWSNVEPRAIRIEGCLDEIRDEEGNPLLPFRASADLRLSDPDHATLSVFFIEIPFERRTH